MTLLCFLEILKTENKSKSFREFLNEISNKKINSSDTDMEEISKGYQ